MLVNLPVSSNVMTSITRTVTGPIVAVNAIAAALPCEPRTGPSSASLRTRRDRAAVELEDGGTALAHGGANRILDGRVLGVECGNGFRAAAVEGIDVGSHGGFHRGRRRHGRELQGFGADGN